MPAGSLTPDLFRPENPDPNDLTQMATHTSSPSPEPGIGDIIRQFASYYAPYRRLFLLDFGCAIVVGLLELGFPLAIKVFVDELLPAQNWLLILLAAAGLLAIYLVNTALTAVVVYWGHMLGINIETNMRRKAFEHLQKLSFRFYDNNKTGHLITRVTKDLEEIGEVAGSQRRHDHLPGGEHLPWTD